MNNLVSNLIEQGRRPHRLRMTLRAKTRPLRLVLHQATILRRVKTPAPINILGGELLGLLSLRLQSVLQADESLRIPIESSNRQVASWSSVPAVASSMPPAFSPVTVTQKLSNVASGTSSVNPLTGLRQFNPSGHRNRTQSPTPFAASAPEHESQTVKMQAIKLLESESSGKQETNLPSFEQPRRDRTPIAATSVLAQKLKQYWELHHNQETMKKEAVQQRASNTQLNEAELHPQSTSRSRSASSWPEQTAQQLARQMRGAGRSLSSSQTRQQVQTGTPDKLEIQNIFNIELKSSAGNLTDTASELADSLSEILREQALQHGIDIT
jgi:hypothetical protein